MKKMHLIGSSIAAVVVTMAVAGGAVAGTKITQPTVVTYDTTSGFGSMSGSYGAARNSLNTVEHISCMTTASSKSPAMNYAFCAATNASGFGQWCFSYDPGVIASVKGLSDSSWVNIVFEGVGGECVNIRSGVASSDEPKK